MAQTTISLYFRHRPNRDSRNLLDIYHQESPLGGVTQRAKLAKQL